MPSRAASAVILSWSREKVKASSVIRGGEVLGDLVAVDHRADPECDGVLATQRAALAPGRGGDLGEFGLGRVQQGVAFGGALLGQRRVAAAHQPFAEVVRAGDSEEIVFVEQRQLDRPLLDQGLDLRGAQRSDPVQPARAQLIVDAGGGEHASVADQADAGQPELLFEFRDLRGQGLRVGGVAFEHLDRDRDAGGRAEQPVDDSQPTLHPIAGMPDLAQRASVPLERGGGHVVEHQGAVGQVPLGQRGLDAVLAGQHPVHRLVQVVLVTAGHPKHLAQRAGRGLGAQPARGRQLRTRSITPATSIAVTRSRIRDSAGSSSCSSPSRRAVPSTAATCPCGRLRSTSNASAS